MLKKKIDIRSFEQKNSQKNTNHLSLKNHEQESHSTKKVLINFCSMTTCVTLRKNEHLVAFSTSGFSVNIFVKNVVN